jgi:hypothetical protein
MISFRQVQWEKVVFLGVGDKTLENVGFEVDDRVVLVVVNVKGDHVSVKRGIDSITEIGWVVWVGLSV